MEPCGRHDFFLMAGYRGTKTLDFVEKKGLRVAKIQEKRRSLWHYWALRYKAESMIPGVWGENGF